MKITFIEGARVRIVPSLNNSSYEAVYIKGEQEFIDILDDGYGFVYAQFENGEVGYIPKKSFRIDNQHDED